MKTSTGIWAISYDAENRSTDFTKIDSTGSTTVHCEYDYMGRRTTKIVTVDNNVTLRQRYIYRGYLQIACIDLTRSHHPALWYITWDPTQPVATRPLAIQKDGTWFTYGWDLTKNICELYGPSGYIRSSYSYSPYGLPSQSTNGASAGDITQPIQWSNEFNDTELGLVYYNYRHYNPVDGRWIGRDSMWSINTYTGIENRPLSVSDFLGCAVLPTPDKYVGPTDRWGYHRPSSLQCSKYAGISTERISELLSLISQMNIITCPKIKKNKFKIDVYREAINLEAVKALPWDGYDLAILFSHTGYVSEHEFTIQNHYVCISSRDLVAIRKDRLVVFGCHLSGRPKGTIPHAEAIVAGIKYMKELEKRTKCTCDSPLKVQVVSGDF